MIENSRLFDSKALDFVDCSEKETVDFGLCVERGVVFCSSPRWDIKGDHLAPQHSTVRVQNDSHTVGISVYAGIIFQPDAFCRRLKCDILC
ncbi:hypothetical protein GJAV_G00022270 [Gymnothorax javanicus]|nr:hypothetical protein GJAV_G00022270 [Gymnothorax javanicus]